MSNLNHLPRARFGQVVHFKDASGKVVTGRAVRLKNDSVMVLAGYGARGTLWVVPYQYITHTSVNETLPVGA